MLNYDNYSIDITFPDTDIELGKQCKINGLDILESMNSIPYFELDLEAQRFSPMDSIRTMTLTYKSASLNYSCPMGVYSLFFTGRRIFIRGWLTEWENFKTTNTRYLGDNVKDAINKLQIRDKLNYSDNITGKLFQVNETNLQQCLNLCTMAARYPYWSIGRYSINLDEKMEDDEDAIPTFNGNLTFIPYPENEILQDTSSTDTKPDGVADNSQWNQSLEGSSFGRSLDVHLQEHADQYNNLLKMKKLHDLGLRYYMNTAMPKEFTYPVGTKLPNKLAESFPNINHWIVNAVYYHYNRNSVRSDIQYGGIVNDN